VYFFFFFSPLPLVLLFLLLDDQTSGGCAADEEKIYILIIIVVCFLFSPLLSSLPSGGLSHSPRPQSVFVEMESSERPYPSLPPFPLSFSPHFLTKFEGVRSTGSARRAAETSPSSPFPSPPPLPLHPSAKTDRLATPAAKQVQIVVDK